MSIKKLSLLSIFFFIMLATCIVAPLAAENTEDALAIKQQISNYLRGIADKNLNLVMGGISENYYEPGSGIGYGQFKSDMENLLNELTRASVGEPKINIVDLGDSAGIAEVEYSFTGLKAGSAAEFNILRKSKFYLEKKDDSWYIFRIERID